MPEAEAVGLIEQSPSGWVLSGLSGKFMHLVAAGLTPARGLVHMRGVIPTRAGGHGGPPLQAAFGAEGGRTRRSAPTRRMGFPVHSDRRAPLAGGSSRW